MWDPVRIPSSTVTGRVTQRATRENQAGLTGFALFVSITGMFLSLFLLLVPLANEKFDKLTRVARAIKEDRATFVLVGTGTTFSFLIACVALTLPKELAC